MGFRATCGLWAGAGSLPFSGKGHGLPPQLVRPSTGRAFTTGHLAQCPAETSTSGGRLRAHSATRNPQRGSNGHPAGTACGVGTVRGPGLHTFDMSLNKFFNFTEQMKLQFRAEAINLTNTPILTAPNTGVGGNLGLLQGSQGARQVQFALKFLF